jgi:hypothetical protein
MAKSVFISALLTSLLLALAGAAGELSDDGKQDQGN